MSDHSSRKAFLPMVLRSDGLRAVIIGGGRVALRRARLLVGRVRSLRVIAPEVRREFRALRGVRISQRAYRRRDLDAADILYVAVDDARVRDRIRDDLRRRRRRILVNIADFPEGCDFYTPAVIRRGLLTIAVSSGGYAPAASAQLRRHLEAKLNLKTWAKRFDAVAARRRA